MNAILLAAGMGTRLRPLTDDKPKSLVEVAGESFFARLLRQLRSVGVRSICVVTGYRDEAFAAWHGEAGLEFLRNDHFADRNNLWSMFLARERLGDCFVVEGDIRLADGVLPFESPPRSCIFAGLREEVRNEWLIEADPEDRIRRIEIASGSGLIHAGLSYWTREDGLVVSRMIEDLVKTPDSEQLFWDEAPRRGLDRLDLRVRRIASNDWDEIDTMADKEALEARLARA
jgi:CTP:phosphocholine cytidylyltransferase-like protein